jgi:thimet oligopeptidase
MIFLSSLEATAGAPRPSDPPFWTGREDAAAFANAQGRRLQAAQTHIDALLKVKGKRTAENTLEPYDRAVFELDSAASHSALVENVHPDEPLRGAAEKTSQEAAAAWTRLSLHRGVYEALAAVPAETADAETRHYLQKTLRDFRLSGVDKDEKSRERIARLREELVQIGQEFSRNIRGDRRTVYVRDAGELTGLPADYIERHKPDERGVIRITSDYPDVFPVFAYARSDSLRRAVYMEYNNRGCPNNLDVLDRMLARRHELANLLGFATWADYVTADKMVGRAATASAFIDRVVDASGPKASAEYERLLAAKRREQPEATAVEGWESSYWAEQVRQAEYAFDSQAMRPYFPFAQVKQGLLDLSSRLFGVTFRRIEGAPVWHPSVECWEMLEDGEVIGRFYLDLFPRANKYNHAAQFDIRAGVKDRHLPEAALVCNFPGGEPGDAGLMEHKDIETFFHEFGHLLHSLFAGGHRWAGVAGIRTEHDFVEAPSQMLEEWTWDPPVLATFARHHETGELIPAEMVRQMKRANEFGKGLLVRRQMALARTSLAYHDRPPDRVSTDALFREISEKYLPYRVVEGTHFQCAFAHLDGYSAVYYTYMWSLVIAKDMLAQFDSKNLLDPSIARRYREQILMPGGSAPAGELLTRFLGRPFNDEAWVRWLNE